MQTIHRSVILTVVLTVLLVLTSCVPIQPPAPVTVTEPALAPPTRILIVGSEFMSGTYTNVDALLKGLANAADPTLDVEVALTYLSGSLQQHWDKGDALEAIRSGDWDVVILEQDLAASAANVQYFERVAATYHEYVRQFHTAITESGAQTMLVASAEYMYPRKKNVDDFYQVVSTVAKELDVAVAPVGFAFQRARAEDSTLVFTETQNPVVGAYLIAAVLYATIYDRSPEGITWLPADDLADDPKLEDIRRALTIAPEMRDLLLLIAWETVQETAD